MRHRVKLNHLGRKTAHRKALLSHLACDLIRHKRIITTLAKAKALRVYVEPLITKSKTNTTHQRRIVFSYLQDKEAVTELFSDISAKIGTRPGGYTRIIKLGARMGDAAEMAMIELVDYNEIYSNEPVDTGKKRRTRRGGSRSKKSTPAGNAETAAKAKEDKEAGEKPAEVASPKTEKKAATDKKEAKEAVVTGAEVKAAQKTAEPAETKETPKAESKTKETEGRKEEAPKAGSKAKETEGKKEETPKAESKAKETEGKKEEAPKQESKAKEPEENKEIAAKSKKAEAAAKEEKKETDDKDKKAKE